MTKDSTTTVKPTTILTGFLGAGKTTYLNHLLKTRSDTRFAIIENEFGEQSIDSELVIQSEDNIVELNNGCLCCTLNDNLYDILNTLFDRRAEYDEIIIEATGVADPRGLAEPFIAHPAIKKQFPLTRIICLIDAELVEDQLQETEEAIHQITFSDVLLINKTDLVSEQYVRELTQRLQGLNPLAKVVLSNQTHFPPIEGVRDIPRFDDVIVGETPKHHHHDHHDHHNHDDHHDHHDHHHHHAEPGDHFPVHRPHAHHHHEHTKEVVSHTLIFNHPFDVQTLRLRLMMYLTFQAKGLYRMKGLLWLKDHDQQCVLQTVGKRLDISPKRPWEVTEKRECKIVVIGKNIQKEGLEKMFIQCLVTPSNTTS
ncbi:MAG: GTP-binding protein [Bacteroidota bacterium]